MEARVLKGFSDLGYSGPGTDNSSFSKAVEGGPKSTTYTELVNYLTNELRSLCGMDEQVNAITNSDDHVIFQMELSSFLKELGCPHEPLTQGHISDRLATKGDKLLLLDYLIAELMAARIMAEKVPEKKIELKLQETTQAASLRKMLMVLRFPKPPANITVQTLFQKLTPTIQSTVQKAGNELLGNPILNATLSEKQWNILNNVQKEMHSEYTIRREMLLKRLDCTIQSFQWSDKTKGKDELITKKYCEKRKQMKVEPDVSMADLISAREDLAIIEKTSSASVRKNTQTSINKVIIGQVPDRGGRTSEQAPPPPEMPSWQQRSSGPSGGGGGRGGFQGGGRGGYNQGGGGRGGGYQGGSNYNQGGGNYNQGGGNYGQGGDYNRGGDFGSASSRDSIDYSRGVNQGGFTYKGKYGGGGTTYNSGGGGGGGNYSSRNQSFDSAGSYTNTYSGAGGNYPKGGNYNSGGGGNYNNQKDDYRPYDSAGSYGNNGRNANEYQDAKRAKTYDYFQKDKTTYADQYVQESQQNQQYRPKSDNSGGRRGRSNYNRGGGNSYR